MEKLKRLSAEELRALCIKNQWFTCGTNEQYRELFRLNELGADIDTLSMVIYICSDMKKWPKLSIYGTLRKAMELKSYNLELDEDEIACIMDALSFLIDERRSDIRDGYIDNVNETEKAIEASDAVYGKLMEVIK